MRTALPMLGIAALMLAACAPQAELAAQPDSLTAQAPPVYQTSAPVTPDNTGISVSGTGIVTGTPDTLTLTMGVSILRPTVQEAVEASAERAQQLIDALEAEGVAERDVQTANYSIWPQYDYQNDQQILRGYQVDNTLSIKIRDLDRAGEIIDAATAAGGDAARVNGLRFALEDNADMLVAAREAAWQDALSKAQQLADLAGVGLAAPIRIAENVSTPSVPIPYERALAADAAFTTPIEAGESQVTVTVSVTFGIGS